MIIRRFSLALVLILFTSMIACSDEGQREFSGDDEATLFKKASRAEIEGDFKKAVDIYLTIAGKFPDSDNRDKALFMAGYLKFENLKEKDEALGHFNELLDKYPDSDLADDTEFMIKAIQSGKDAISTFEESQQ